MSGTPKSWPSKSGKCATSSRLGSSNFPSVVVVVVEVKADVVVVRRGRIEGIRHRAPGRLSPHLEHGEWGRRGRVRWPCWRIMRIWEVTCPGGAGTRRARAAAPAPSLRADRARSRSPSARGAVPRATEPRRARSSRSRVPRRFENHLNPNPRAGRLRLKSERVHREAHLAVDCDVSPLTTRGARASKTRALLARRLPDRVDGRRRQWTRAWTRWRESAVSDRTGPKSTASGGSPPKTAPLR